MSLSLTIDYGNGALKHFGSVNAVPSIEDPSDRLDLFDLLDAAAQLDPGLEYEFRVALTSDKAGNQGGTISSVDGVSADGAAWQVCVNRQPGMTELRRPTPDSFQPQGEPRLVL